MLTHYFKSAWRNLVRKRTYSFINIAGLSLGLASTWLIALYIIDELSYDRFDEKSERIFRVVQHSRWNNNEMHQATTSAPFAPALKAAFPEIEDAVRIDREGGGVITYGDKNIKQDDVIFADKSLLNVFSYSFLYGNHTALENPESIVITESLAKKLFGTAEKAFKQIIYFDTRFPATITGVIKDIPRNSHLRFSAVRVAPDDFFAGNWQNFSIYTYLLLKEGVNVNRLREKLPDFANTTIKKQVKVDDYSMELQPATSIHLHSNLAFELSPNGNITRVYIFIAIALLILIIAIINYTNLTTARASARIKEIGVRKAIGSGKGNVAGIFITEALLVTFIAACVAIVIVNFSLPFFNQLTEKDLSLEQPGVLTTTAALLAFSVLTGLISGIYPSVFLAGFKTIPALKGQMGNMSGSILFRRSLVVFQFFITILMIASSIIIYQQLHFAKNTSLGFNKDQVLTFHIDDQNVRKQVGALKTQLLKNPDIEGVSAAGNPIGNNNLGGMGYRFEIPQGGFSTATTLAQELIVDMDFLPTLDITLLQGRNFSPEFTSDKYGSALINESLMKKLGWKSAVGKRMQFSVGDNSAPLERTIVGVVKDFHTYSLQHKIEPLVMVMPPSSNAEDNIYVKIANGKIADGLAFTKQAFSEFDKTNHAAFSFLDENFAKQYEAEEKQGKLALIFAVLAIFIACLGLFGLAAFTTVQRTREIGIRKAMGASITDIVQLLSSDFMKLVILSAAIALPVAWVTMNEWLQGFAYRIDVKWWVLLLAGFLAFFIALIPVSLQTIRAAVANPVKSLRTE